MGKHPTCWKMLRGRKRPRPFFWVMSKVPPAFRWTKLHGKGALQQRLCKPYGVRHCSHSELAAQGHLQRLLTSNLFPAA